MRKCEARHLYIKQLAYKMDGPFFVHEKHLLVICTSVCQSGWLCTKCLHVCLFVSLEICLSVGNVDQNGANGIWGGRCYGKMKMAGLFKPDPKTTHIDQTACLPCSVSAKRWDFERMPNQTCERRTQRKKKLKGSFDRTAFVFCLQHAKKKARLDLTDF